jgi:hypothetical protein
MQRMIMIKREAEEKLKELAGGFPAVTVKVQVQQIKGEQSLLLEG